MLKVLIFLCIRDILQTSIMYFLFLVSWDITVLCMLLNIRVFYYHKHFQIYNEVQTKYHRKYGKIPTLSPPNLNFRVKIILGLKLGLGLG